MMRVDGGAACIVGNNGIEFGGRCALEMQGPTGVACRYIYPGKLQHNAYADN